MAKALQRETAALIAWISAASAGNGWSDPATRTGHRNAVISHSAWFKNSVRSVAVLTKLGTDIARTCRNKSIGHEAVLVRGMTDQEIEDLKSALSLTYKNAREGL